MDTDLKIETDRSNVTEQSWREEMSSTADLYSWMWPSCGAIPALVHVARHVLVFVWRNEWMSMVVGIGKGIISSYNKLFRRKQSASG